MWIKLAESIVQNMIRLICMGVLAQIGRAVGVVLLEFVTFPWWWYGSGFRRVLTWAGRTLRGWEHTIGLRLWAKNLFVPMFGQTDWQGRLISFCLRLVILIGRTIQVVVGAILVFLAMIIYLALPPGVILLAIAPLWIS